jgi:hypothetical protein
MSGITRLSVIGLVLFSQRSQLIGLVLLHYRPHQRLQVTFHHFRQAV